MKTANNMYIKTQKFGVTTQTIRNIRLYGYWSVFFANGALYTITQTICSPTFNTHI